MNGVAMAVAIYLRVSTDEQRERQTIETQREELERFCRLQDLRIAQTYADDGTSGTIPVALRPAGGQMLRDARAKKFDRLLVYKLDRLGRDTMVTLEAVAELAKCGVRVVSITEACDGETSGGRLMLTIHSAFAAHEREVIRERSLAGTNRVAQSGAWLGGVVPFGYRKVGQKMAARLVISEDLIPDVGISEADVIRMIYGMASMEGKSCFHIGDQLNRLAIPCSYVRDEKMVTRGKRKTRTSGLWRPGRIRNMLVNSTYMGQHQYGKRSRNPNRELIGRTVPAIVTEDVWRKAQKTLRSNVLFSSRHSKRQYLLRGLMKCGLCGLTYIGVSNRRRTGKEDFYYRCNGKHGTRGLFGANGHRCPSKDVNGHFLEQSVWADVEGFLRHPGAVIEQLRVRLASERSDSKRGRERLAHLESALAKKTGERDRILGLFRKGRISETDLDRQMDQIDREEAGIRANIETLASSLRGVADAGAHLQSTQAFLEKLRTRLDQGLSWEVKRQLIEALVGSIRIDTVEEDGTRRASIVVTYRFASSIAVCTDTRADSNWSIQKVYTPPLRWAA
jgi:site-specific DNA recombinase